MVLSTFCWIKLCLKNHYAAKSFQQSLFFEEFLKCNVILEAHYISFMPKLWKVFNFPEKKVCNLLCRHIFILMLTYNKIEDIFDKNIFWRVKQAFVITHNCWRSIFENIMLTKLVMSYYLQSSFSSIIKPFSNMLVPNLHLQKTWWHKQFFTISKNACQLLEAVS